MQLDDMLDMDMDALMAWPADVLLMPSIPVGVIELKPAYWQYTDISGNESSSWARDTDAAGGSQGIVLDVVPGENQPGRWLLKGGTEIAYLKGVAHAGHLDPAVSDQAAQDARVTSIEIWGWRDGDGDGRASPADANAHDPAARCSCWTLLSQLCPASGSAYGHAVGGSVCVPYTAPAAGADPNFTLKTGKVGDVLQAGTWEMAQAIPIGEHESWLLLIRIQVQDGWTNLMGLDGVERWWNGVSGGGSVGSGTAGDQYLDSTGKYATGAKAGQQAVPDDAIVWVYRPKA